MSLKDMRSEIIRYLESHPLHNDIGDRLKKI